MSQDVINWIHGVIYFDANPVATVALDRPAWERRGARFTEVDDGDGDTPGLAVGTVVVDAIEVKFGVLDFLGDSTFVLLPSSDREVADTLELLRDLEDKGVLDLEAQLLHVGGLRRGPTIEERVAALERQVARAVVAKPQAA